MSRKCKDWLDTYLAYTDNSEPPTLFKIWCGISAICSALQRKCWMEWDTYTYPNMYIVLVAPPGKGRKGTAMKPAQNLIADLGIAQAPKSVSRSAMIKAMVNAKQETEIEGENIVHNSLSVYSSELSVFLGKENYELIATLTMWFDCEPDWNYSTRLHGEEMVEGIWVNMLGATTPEYLASSLPQDAVGGGLTSRIIFVYGDRKSKICPTPFPTSEEVALYETLIHDLERILMLAGRFEYTGDWLDAHTEWYKASEEKPPFDEHPVLGKYVERRSLHLRKLCMAMSASRSNELVLRKVDFDRALSILLKTEQLMPYVFSGRGRASHSVVLAQVLKWLAQTGVLTLEDIIRRFKHDATQSEILEIIRLLENGGYAEFNWRSKTLAYKDKR